MNDLIGYLYYSDDERVADFILNTKGTQIQIIDLRTKFQYNLDAWVYKTLVFKRKLTLLGEIYRKAYEKHGR